MQATLADGAERPIAFLNQASGGRTGKVLGHGSALEALRVGLPRDLPARHFKMEPWTRAGRLLAHGIGPLAPKGWDGLEARWYLVEAVRGYAAALRIIADVAPRGVHVTSHSLALGMSGLMSRVPFALCADVSLRDWSEMAIWTRSTPVTLAALKPILKLERDALQRSAVVLAWSQWTKASIIRAVPEARVVVHHPGLDLSRYLPASRKGSDEKRILFVGGRFSAKGGDDLLSALQPRLGHDVTLDVVSTEPPDARDGVRIHQLGAHDPRLIDLYQQADLLCLPSYGEAVPWTVLEALACGVPVIASDVGAIPELLDNGRRGLLVRPGGVTAIREAVETLLDDPARRATMGLAGRRAAEAAFDARIQGRELVDILDAAFLTHRTKEAMAAKG
jgi:hypothetical protein